MQWKRWITKCLSSSIVFVLVNGSPIEEFRLNCRLRQGKPLSLFLFLIATEGLNALMSSSVNVGLFKGVRAGEDDDLHMTYLQFAHDTLIMGEKSWTNIRAIKTNMLLFVVVVLNCKVGGLPLLYLGWSIEGNLSRLSCWHPVIECIQSRLNSQKSHNLSMGVAWFFLKPFVCPINLLYLFL